MSRTQLETIFIDLTFRIILLSSSKSYISISKLNSVSLLPADLDKTDIILISDFVKVDAISARTPGSSR